MTNNNRTEPVILDLCGKKGELSLKKHGVLRARLAKELELLRKAYRMSLQQENRTGVTEWLCDNYYIFEREGRTLIRELKVMPPLPTQKGQKLAAIYNLCNHICKEQNGIPSTETLEEILRAANQIRSLEGRELDALPMMLRIAMLHLAATACKDTGDEAGNTLKMGGAVKSLRSIASTDFSELIEQQSCVEIILRQDPAGTYPLMTEETRSLYRRRISETAVKTGESEEDLAKSALKMAKAAKGGRERHVGYYILGQGSWAAERRSRGRKTLFFAAFIPAVLSVVIGILSGIPLIALAIFLPLWEGFRAIFEYIGLKGVAPSILPRMDLDGTIPPDQATLVVISTLLPPPEKARELYHRLERLFFTNGRGHIRYCVLADLKEAKYPSLPEDAPAIAAAKRVVATLNQKHGDRFFLCVRPRVYSKTQRAYSGWERKRGAITGLVRQIMGHDEQFLAFEGNKAGLAQSKYMIALDSDTELLMDSAADLVAAAMHPLNRPVIDEERAVVTDGYGIIAPRMATSLTSASKTPFSRIMEGQGGVTAYDTASGDLYQDLFGEGIFAGKGLIDIAAFSAVMDTAFSEGTVLSHDILEGGFLRTAFMSDVEMIDSCPSTLASWMSRLHRWMRGDWQNINWISSAHKRFDGKKNPLSALSRYKIFDNLRRSATPAVALVCLILAAFLPSFASRALVVSALFSACGAGLFSMVCSLISGGISMLSRKYYSKAMPVAMQALMSSCIYVVSLPKTALVSLDATCRALWRLVVSKKGLLDWTTAADGEKKGGTFLQSIRGLWLPELFGIALLVFGGGGLIRLCGILFSLLLPVALLTAQQTSAETPGLSPKERERVLSYTAAMWRYYEDTFCAADHYLPPDNVQEAPVSAIAHRTSPTNIGLLMLSTLAARDFGFIDTPSLASRIGLTLDSIDNLEKWHGNLYNWYDTKTLRPLHPRYASAVDSGNFACSLVSLREGLTEYASENKMIPDLIRRLDILIEETDLTPFYNRRRKLFHIGYDLERQALSESYYDLLMSESRMTSFFAIARRQVPKKHWGALGRTLARSGGYTGPVSWTGTTFEYFMPHLLLPSPEGSLGFEALRFCTFCQRRRVRGKNVPWGISESGFYAFDASLNYQYKAHGVQKLGLKRGLDSELVLSPYSSFLVMPFEPKSALANLAKFEKLGMLGRCGFFEATDFTRCGVGGRNYAIVRSYMAHHVGMSIIAAANLLQDNIFQKRFLKDGIMESATELLEEKIPSGAVVFDDIMEREVPDKPGRSLTQKEVLTKINPTAPHMHLLSNGEWSLAVSDTGAGLSLYRGVDITRHSPDILRRPQGVFAAVSCGNTSFSLTAAPDYHDTAQHRVEFAPSYAAFYAEKGFIEAGMMATVHPRLPSEQRQFIIRNKSNARQEAELILYFEPCLAKRNDDTAHPAFSRLFLQSKYEIGSAVLLFSRRKRSGEHDIHLAAGFAEPVAFEYDCSRERILSRPAATASILEAASIPFKAGQGIPDSICCMKVKMELPPKAQKTLTLILCAASTEEEALSRLITARDEGALTPTRAALSPLVSGGMEARLADTVLPLLLYPLRDGPEGLEAARRNRLGSHALWSLGISGDLPIVLVNIQEAGDAIRAEAYIRLHRELYLAGIKHDLVILFKEGGDYALPILAAIKDAARRQGSEQLLSAPGGIHPVDAARHSEDTIVLLMAASCHIAPESLIRPSVPVPDYTPIQLLQASKRPLLTEDYQSGEMKVLARHDVWGGKFSGDTFTFSKTPRLPWCHLLCNATFGTLVSESALGFTWSVNSRENKLTPWYNDSRTDNRGEMLLIKIGGKVYDCLLYASAVFSPSAAVYSGKIEDLNYTATVTVPSKGNVKEIVVEIDNKGSDCSIQCAYYTEPVLGVNRDTARHITAKWEKGTLLLSNPWNSAVPGTAILSSDAPNTQCCCDRPAFLSGRWDEHMICPLPDPCAALVVPQKLIQGEKARIRFVLGFASCESAAVQLPALPLQEKRFLSPREKTVSITIKTPSPALDVMINTWLPHQILASRYQGRTGFFQCGGAWGFRDQLQDCCAIMINNPAIARQHIARAAAHQFIEGDVLHWWHTLPKGGGGERGVRTRYSDDLLWLPYTICRYIERTKDRSILEIPVRYLEAPELTPDEHEKYFAPRRSTLTEDIYNHAIRAIERSLKFGAHGLPLIGGGDWNDGYNLVGIDGKGESVWLGMFLSMVLTDFSQICRDRNDLGRADRYIEEASRLRSAIDANAWDGDWYLRAFFDNGSPMGSHKNAECRLDSLPQSFSVLCGMPDGERQKSALDWSLRLLEDHHHKYVRLFYPAYDKCEQNPGYVKSYPPGIRENGGQYTHAACWLAMALLKAGRADDGWRILQTLNPADVCQTQEDATRYALEPYAMAGDVYDHVNAQGRGGWSHYTGASGWYYRIVIEEFLGIKIRGDEITVTPNLPKDWEGFEARIILNGETIKINETGIVPK